MCGFDRCSKRSVVFSLFDEVDREASVNGHADVHYKMGEISQESIRGSGMRVRSIVGDACRTKLSSSRVHGAQVVLV